MKRPEPDPGFDLAHARVAAAVAQRDAQHNELEAWIASALKAEEDRMDAAVDAWLNPPRPQRRSKARRH